MKLLINITAWNAHVDRMWSLLVPSLLAPGNLPALAQRHEVRLDIWTKTKAEYHAIVDHPLCKALAKIAPGTINVKDTKELAVFHQHTINDAIDLGAGCLVLMPDTVLSDGCLEALSRHIDAGAQAVMVPGPRALLRRGSECLEPHRHGDSIRIAPRQLVNLLIECLHPVTQSLVVNGPLSSIWPSHLYWNVGRDEGMIARCWHMHPLFFVPKDMPVGNSIDGEYLNRINPTGDGIVYATNSDEMCAVEFSPWSHMINSVSEDSWDRKSLEGFAWRQSPLHRKHAAQSLRLIADGPTESLWQKAEDDARQFMEGLSCRD